MAPGDSQDPRFRSSCENVHLKDGRLLLKKRFLNSLMCSRLMRLDFFNAGRPKVMPLFTGMPLFIRALRRAAFEESRECEGGKRTAAGPGCFYEE